MRFWSNCASAAIPSLSRLPTADVVQRDDADGDDAGRKENCLHGIDVGHGAQPAGCDIDDNHRGEQPHADFNPEQAVRQHVKKKTRGTQLDPKVGYRKDQGDEHHQESDRVGLEVVRKHFSGCHEPITLAQHPLTLEKDDAG